MKTIKRILRSCLCWLGIHTWRYRFGWAKDKRFDCCLNNLCNASRWVDDKVGFKEMLKRSKS